MEPRTGMVCARLLPDELLKSFWVNRGIGHPLSSGGMRPGLP
jgi:hypothetical protein